MNQKVLFTFFVVSLLFLLPAASAQEKITGDVTRTFTTIKPALPKTITENVLGPAGTPVFEMRLDSARTLVQVRISLEKLDLQKADLDILPGGIVYDYFNISGKNIKASDLESLRLRFRVPVEWTKDNNVEPRDIKLLATSSSNIWLEIGTEITSEDSGNLEYVSEITQPDIPNLDSQSAIFAIVGESSVGQPEPVTQQDDVQDTSGTAQPETAEDIIEIEPEEFLAIEQQEDQSGAILVVGVVIIILIIAFLFLVPGSVMRKTLGKNQRKKFHS